MLLIKEEEINCINLQLLLFMCVSHSNISNVV